VFNATAALEQELIATPYWFTPTSSLTRVLSRSRDPLLSNLDNLMRRAIENEIHIRNHPAVNSHGSLLNQPSRLAGRGRELQVDEQSANPG
jgi:hypothetical protein